MSSRNEEIRDPALADLPASAFDEIEGSPTPEQLEFRIRAKREQAAQDAGWITSPHAEADIEPIPPEEPSAPPPAEEETEAEHSDADDDVDVLDREGEQAAEDEPDETPEAEAETEDDFYVGRYRTREEAEQGIAEQHKTIAKLFRDQHERRAQQQEAQQQEGQPQPQLDPDAWHAWAEEAVNEGGGVQGAIAALERGGPQGYDIYISHWLQDEDPASRAEAIAFNNEVTRQFAAQQAQLAAQAVQPQQNGVAPAPEAEAEAAKSTVAAKYPDFKDVESEIDRLVLEEGALDDGTKQWLASMANEGVDGKARAWEYLYLVAQSTRAPVRAKATAEERKRRRASADAATIAATVSSSEGTPGRTPLPEADLAVIRKRNGIRERAGLPLLPEE